MVVRKEMCMSYDVARRMILVVAQEAGVSVDNIGLHGLRVGSATEYGRRGASEDLVREKGRWKTMSSRIRYTRILQEDLVAAGDMF